MEKAYSIHILMTYMQHKNHSFLYNSHIFVLQRPQLYGKFVISHSWNCTRSIDIPLYKLGDHSKMHIPVKGVSGKNGQSNYAILI